MIDEETGRPVSTARPEARLSPPSDLLASSPSPDKPADAAVHSAPALSNSLTVLAGRIRDEHLAVAESMRDSVRHAIAAGEALVEAKEQVPHGGWLPWLRDHCSMSERTAQLYMRCAKNRAAIEANAQSVADLTLNEAAALLMLSSDVRKLMNFVREVENLHGEDLIERCIAEGVTVIKDPDYDQFAGRSDAEILEWHLFVAFLSFEAGQRSGMMPQNAALHVEWICQRPFQNVDEWLGEEGDKYRRRNGYTRATMGESFMADWAAFRDAHRDCTLADVTAKLDDLERRFDEARAAGRLHSDEDRPRRRRRRRAV